jgi:hypothetical protein
MAPARFTYVMPPAMAARFEPLATYNAEKLRGLVHTPEWDAAMAELQREFDQLRP